MDANEKPCRIFVIMGVCGCGKTTVAQRLSEMFGWPVAEADGYHSSQNKQKMAAGIPLTDQDRLPWLLAIHEIMQKWLLDGKSGIVTCSALKKSYRNILLNGQVNATSNAKVSITSDSNRINYRNSHHKNLSDAVTFIFLKGSESLLRERLQTRTGHFMHADLLTSQLQTLEEPDDTECHLVVNIESSLQETLDVMRDYVQKINSL